MTFVPVMLSAWGVTVAIMVGTLIYRSRLTKDEEDQLFLDDSFNPQKAAQAAIAARAEKFQPIVKSAEILAGVATLFVIGYYILDVVNQFR